MTSHIRMYETWKKTDSTTVYRRGRQIQQNNPSRWVNPTWCSSNWERSQTFFFSLHYEGDAGGQTISTLFSIWLSLLKFVFIGLRFFRTGVIFLLARFYMIVWIYIVRHGFMIFSHSTWCLGIKIKSKANFTM